MTARKSPFASAGLASRANAPGPHHRPCPRRPRPLRGRRLRLAHGALALGLVSRAADAGQGHACPGRDVQPAVELASSAGVSARLVGGGQIRSLFRQGFEVDPERRRAAYGWAAYPCVYTLTINWRADPSRRVREIQGGLLNACTDPSKLIPERPPRRIRRPQADGPSRPLVPGGQSA